MWSKEEIDILMSNIERYLKVCVRVRYLPVGIAVLLLEINFLQHFTECAIHDSILFLHSRNCHYLLEIPKIVVHKI